METKDKSRKKAPFIKLLLLGVLAFALARCVFLDGVEQPDRVKAGETFHASLRAHVDAAEDRPNVRFVIGVLVPRSWKAATSMQVQYTSNMGDGEMVRVPSGVKAPNSGNNLDWSPALMNKFGIGPNLIDDMEWVVFWTKEQYMIGNGDKPLIEAHIAIESGPQNMKFKFGYFIASSADGLNDFLGGPGALYKTSFSDCFEVTDGEGDIQDFCNPPQTFVDPYRSTDNDIITLTYDRDILPGPLKEDIFLCASAELADGTIKQLCAPESTQQLKAVEGAKGRFETTFWPRQYFGLKAEEQIMRITYYFTDSTGNIKVGYANGEDPFVYTFRCE